MSVMKKQFYCAHKNSIGSCLIQCKECEKDDYGLIWEEIIKKQKSEEERIREIVLYQLEQWDLKALSWIPNKLDVAPIAKQIYTEIIEPKDKRIAELERENENLKKIT
jgi:hypothetical protein